MRRRKATVELFEELRRQYEFGVGSVAGVARKFGMHRRLVREALGCAIPQACLSKGRPRPKMGQLAEFIDNIGGLGHFLMMGHAGHMTHEEAVDQITLVAKEVLPRLQKPRPATKQAA